MNNKHVNIASYATLIMAFFMMLYFGYLAFYPFKVIELEPQPYKLMETTIEPGSYIYYGFSYCKYIDVRADIIYQLVGNDVDIALPQTPPQEIDDYTIRLTKQCDETTKGVYIPKHTPPGEYVLYEYIDYQVNFLRNVNYVFKTEPFIVTE